MKRARRRIDSEEPPKKKQKTYSRAGSNGKDAGQRTTDNPFREALRRSVTDVCDQGIKEGFIKLIVALKPVEHSGTLRVVGDVIENGDLVRFEVAFLKTCIRLLAEASVGFDMNDEVLISLKDVHLEPKEVARGGKSVKFLPMTLTFSKGVCLKFVYKKGSSLPGKLLDLWADEEEKQPDSEPSKPKAGPSTGDAPFGDDWFLTPVQPTPSGEPATSSDPPAHMQPPAANDDLADKDTRAGTPAATDAVSMNLDQGSQEDDSTKSTNVPEEVAAPAEQDAEPVKVAPARPLYRNVAGRQTRSTTAALKEKQVANVAPGSGLKDATPPPAPAPLAAPETESSNAPSAKQAKKAQKKAARLAKKAVKKGEQGVTEQESPEPPVMSAHEPTPAQESTLVPAESTSTDENAATEPSVRPSAVEETAETNTPQPRESSKLPKEASTLPTHTVVPKSSDNAPAKAPSQMSLSSLSSSQNLELNLEAGCHGEDGRVYDSLASLTRSYNRSVIAVIALAGQDSKKTSTSEWFCKHVLVDPSNVELDNLSRGFSVNCFSKDAPGLPEGKCGDVIVLTGMDVQDFYDKSSGTCASYSAWAWTLFVPETGKTVHSHANHPDLGSAELRYCIALGDWWRALRREQERLLQASGAVVHQIGEGDASDGRGPRQSINREHRLIQDASPTAHPRGYFDCTVEVLHGHTNSREDVYSLYVTDYTRNTKVAETTAAWCSPELAPYVLRVEMWNRAATRGAELQAGKYVEITNIRMRESRSGYYEGVFKEAYKLREIDEDELEGEPHLQALLERKKKYTEEAEEKGAHRFPDQLISEAKLDSHFCCTVEVLQLKKKDPEHALLWVTDYTSRNDLAPLAATAEWSYGVGAERILKIALTDAQVQVAASLAPGDVVAIRNLRLKALSRGKDVAGMLGGAERLIFKLNTQTTGSEECLALLSRKEAWERRSKDSKADGKTNGKANGKANGVPNGKSSVPAARKKQNGPPKVPMQRPKNAITLRELRRVHDGSKYAKYRIIARMVGYFPEPIIKWTVLRCTQCLQDIPESFRICTRCDSDMADTHVRPFWKFLFEIEDEEGAREQIIGTAPSSSFLPDFLADFPPVDFQEDDDALRKLTDRLRPLLGSELVDNYSALQQSADQDGSLDPSDAPLLNLVIGATEGDDPYLMLCECSPLG